ncbi:hypothetical protein C8R45DRAFT_135696 [Mycena sanguinolenta]|nr:hypothetical protein C8R45DRAFT_135696 [Mycena sanguinolenta]
MDDGLAILTQNGVLVSPEIPAGRGELVYKLALPAPPEGPPINLLYNAFPPKPKCVETLWTLEADSYCSEHPNPPTLEADSCCSEHPNPPPIGIHPCDDEKYLVCYPAFGAFLNYEHGELDRVHWKVSAHQVAFYWPYVLLFSRDQIEVRNICTGTFIQMIGDLGTDLRCIWDNPQHLADTSGVICVSGDSTGIRMFEIQPIE